MSNSAATLWRPQLLASDSASLAAVKQMLAIAALIGGTWMLAVAHLAVVAQLAFVAGAIAIAISYIRRSPWQYLTAVLWFWTISPFVRRVVDYYGGYQATNLCLLAPNLVTLLMLPSILTSRELSKRSEAGSGLLLLIPAFYGLAVTFVKGDIFAGAVASLDWLVPLLFYFYLINLAPRIDEAEAYFRAFIPLNMLIVVVYGIYQYYYPTPWDLLWVQMNKSFTGHDASGHEQLRVFSVLNGPGACAIWVGSLILLSMHFRNWMSMLLLPLAILFLAMTEVRMTAGAVVLGLAVAAFFGDRRVRLSLVGVIAAVAVAGAAMIVLDPTSADVFIARFATVKDLKNDASAQARRELYLAAPALMDRYPLGGGIGIMGKGARIGGGGEMSDFDSGLIAPFVVFGWVPGMIYHIGTLAVVAQACFAAIRSRKPAVLALALVALTALASSLFTPMIGLQGLVLWFSAGYASAIAIKMWTSKVVLVVNRPARDRDQSLT